MKQPIRIFVTDDHRVFIDGVQSILSQIPEFSVVGTSQNGVDTIAALQEQPCDVLLLDVEMPMMNGLEVARMIRTLKIDVKILCLTMHDEREFIVGVMRSGVQGYLLKNSGKQELLEAIQVVASGQHYFSREIASTMMRDFMEQPAVDHNGVAETNEKRLTQREEEIVRLVVQGTSNGEIADKLYVSIRTVETHRRNIMRKLDLKNAIQLVNYARGQNLV
jgi:two-component system, NarL family, nitrate/nitrite response regulator NarL